MNTGMRFSPSSGYAESGLAPATATMVAVHSYINNVQLAHVAYQSNESGRDEIYVRPFPGMKFSLPLASLGQGE